MRLAALALALTLATSAAGCAEPAGDYHLDLVWWINTVEANAGICDEQDIARVRLRVFAPGGGEQAVEYDCAVGQALTGRMQLADNRNLYLRWGTPYEYTFEGLSPKGKVLHSLDSRFEAFAGEYTLLLPAVDIYQPFGEAASVSAEWRFEGMDLADGCAAAGYEEIAVDVASASDPDFVDAVELLLAPCTDGLIDDATPVLATGEYWMRYVGLNARGAADHLGEGIEVSIPEFGIDVPLPTENL